ncbi:hypothetical protein M3P19_13365 [Muricauda sp. 2012CJ35-5]|uniref:Uncharacterized protein n=1 Tax=Flagellimonas spongiicola TaxID=2942208 RepID=A0ABT0PUC4_9FLAO|nr:hypothetical protein [Allomuricauda spongiicola]MCL6275003.1 hypothetical protein [Allomuricauda spongiicola]
MSKNNEDKFYGDPELDSIEFNNTIQVLEYYGHTYKTNGNKIFITKTLNGDWELLWNYTTKANDPDWLKTHEPEKTKPKVKLVRLNPDLIGIYEFKTAEQSGNHYIAIDTLKGEYNGLYFGTEASGGHGIFFYGNSMENLKIENEKISFEIGRRDLYQTTRFRIMKHETDLVKDSAVGVSKEKLKYNGEILSHELKLMCKSDLEYCWENKLSFQKLTEKNK